MVRLPGIRLLLVVMAVVAVLAFGRMLAQDDPNDVPLGDVARDLREKSQPAKSVIDDDNLPQVMERSDGSQRSGFRYLMGRDTKAFQLGARM